MSIDNNGQGTKVGHNIDIDQARSDLASVFRLAAHHDWHEAIANHFSLAVSGDGKQFLMNPRWRHFSTIQPQDLLLLDADNEAALDEPDAPDPSAWCIHGAIHRKSPAARCVLHVHSPYATAMAALQDPTILPIDQNTARFYNRVSYDMSFGGLAHHRHEGERIAASLGANKVLMMANHGVTVVAASVAQAYDLLYYFERACQTMILAGSTGKPLNVMSDKLAEQTATDWETYEQAAFSHFAEMKQLVG
jgi:ribulose-5-phosphate 4-epimerase/fuculose-1-phosphate aldolase